VDQLDLLGFKDLKESDYYGPSLALGAVDVTLWDLVNGYRSLANGGVWRPLRVMSGTTPNSRLSSGDKEDGTDLLASSGQAGKDISRRVLSPETAFILADILSDRESRSLTFSLESPLTTRFWTAVKTGTSKDMRDNWCVGFSSRYTVGVWVGNFSGEPMWNVLGITGAAPVWVDIMNWLHRQLPSFPPLPPKTLQVHNTDFPDLGVTHREWYPAGEEVTVSQAALSGVPARIISPADGEVLAWDPDIPPDQQRVFLEARPQSGQMYWELDGAQLCDAGTIRMWALRPGKHSLKLLSQAGEALDITRFVVRGMQSDDPK